MNAALNNISQSCSANHFGEVQRGGRGRFRGTDRDRDRGRGRCRGRGRDRDRVNI